MTVLPSAWEIEIRGIQPQYVRATGIHRFFSAWFGETPDEHVSIKGYSIGKRTDHADGVTLRLGCVDDSLLPLVTGVRPGQQIQFGTSFPRHGVVAGAPRCVAEESWAELADFRGTTQWRIDFVTPVLLRSDGIDQPWPDPFSLLRGLAAKWRRFGPTIEPTFHDYHARRVGVTGAELSTMESNNAPHPVIAATGRVEWTLLGQRDSERAVVVERLLRLAQYSGMGSYPQFGSGAVNVEGRSVDPRRPRPRRH